MHEFKVELREHPDTIYTNFCSEETIFYAGCVNLNVYCQHDTVAHLTLPRPPSPNPIILTPPHFHSHTYIAPPTIATWQHTYGRRVLAAREHQSRT